MTKVFISYSRKDKPFAEKLDHALKQIDLDSWIDWDDIPPTADWWLQIQKGIEESDAFLFLLSPDSVASQVCGRELEHAAKNNKRMLPLVIWDVEAKQVNSTISHLNWIFFREQDDFNEALGKLRKAIETDFEWVEFHKRLQVRALEWERRKSNSLFLRGDNLREAEEELARVKQKQPRPTDLQRQYVLESRKNETRTRKIVLSAISSAAVMLGIAAVIAILQSFKATDQARLAAERQHTAEVAQATAVAAKNDAEDARKEAVTQQQIAFASRLGAESLETEAGKSSEKLLLAVEALRASEGLPHPPVEAEQAMWAALKDMGGLPISAAGETFDKIFFTDKEHFVSMNFQRIFFWEINGLKVSPNQLTGLTIGDDINTSASAISPDGRWLVVGVNDAIYVWGLQNLEKLPTHLEFSPDSINFSGDSRQLIAGSWVDDEYQYWAWTVGEWDVAPTILTVNAAPIPEISRSIVSSKADSSQLSLMKADALPGSSIAGVMSMLIPVTGGGGGGNMFIKFSLNDQFFATTNYDSVFVWSRSNLSAPVKRLTFDIWPNEISMNDQWVANLYTNESNGAEPTLVFADYTQQHSRPILRRFEGRKIESAISPVMDSKGRWLAVATEPVIQLPNAADFPGAIAIINFQNPIDSNFYYVAPHNAQIAVMEFSPTDQWLASGDTNGDIYLSSFGDQGYSGETRRLRGHDGGVTNLAFSPDGNILLSEDQNGILRLWDISSGANQIAVWPSAITYGDRAVTVSQFGPDNQAFATGFDNGLIALWSVDDINRAPMIFKGLNSAAQLVAFSPSGKWLAAGSSGGEAVVSPTNQEQEPIHLDVGAELYDMTMSADDQRLYTVSDDGVQRWDLNHPAEPLLLDSPGSMLVKDLQLSSDGRWLAGYKPEEQFLILWDVQQPNLDQKSTPAGTFSKILQFVFSADGRWLAYSNGVTINLMDLNKPAGKQITLNVYQGNEFYAGGLAITPDGQSVAIANESAISLWTDPATSQQPILLSNANLYGNVFLRFTNDQRWLIAYGNDTIKIWNMDNFYATPITLERPRGVKDFQLSRNGQWMSILDNYGVVTLWALDPEKRLDLACQVVGRNLTRLEWLTFFPDKPYRASCPQWPIEPEIVTTPTP